MKFKTRLMVTSIVIVLLPLMLTCAAFLLIGSHIEDAEGDFSLLDVNRVPFTYTIENYSQITEDLLHEVNQQITSDSVKLEDREYLDEISAHLNSKFSYIIVRKGDSIYYTSNLNAARKIFSTLPEYGNEMPDMETGYYYNDMKKLVKQADFEFTDGDKGSFFIVSGVSSLISKRALRNMIVAFILVLVFTSLVLTQWIQKGIFTPINQLDIAMQNIAEGNLEYMLTTQEICGSG